MRTRAKILSVAVSLLLVLIVGALFAASRPEQMVASHLSKLLEQYGYTMYTPFRGSDFPSTIFVLAENNKGRMTEFTVSRWDETFEIAPDLPYEKTDGQVALFNSLREEFTFDSSLAAEFLSLFLKAEVALKYTKSLTIRLGDPKTTHVLTLAHLATLRDHLSEAVAKSLRFYKTRGQLDYAYIVLETLTVGSITIEVTYKPEYSGKLSMDDVTKAVTGNATVKNVADKSFSLESATPLMIGYKAAQIPDTLLSGEVQPMITLDIIPASEFNATKSE